MGGRNTRSRRRSPGGALREAFSSPPGGSSAGRLRAVENRSLGETSCGTEEAGKVLASVFLPPPGGCSPSERFSTARNGPRNSERPAKLGTARKITPEITRSVSLHRKETHHVQIRLYRLCPRRGPPPLWPCCPSRPAHGPARPTPSASTSPATAPPTPSTSGRRDSSPPATSTTPPAPAARSRKARSSTAISPAIRPRQPPWPTRGPPWASPRRTRPSARTTC